MPQPLLPRSPSDDSLRTRRFIDMASKLLNSFIRTGVFAIEDQGEWGMGHLLFTGNGPPPADLAFQGSYYLDLTDGVLYEKQ